VAATEFPQWGDEGGGGYDAGEEEWEAMMGGAK
jgi:hypothetical protein